jgi:ribokinase
MLTVIGSINMDLVVTSPEIPKVGETVLGRDFNQYPGGKGANQAVAAAQLNMPVCFLGCVGDDSYGSTMINSMMQSSIDVSRIRSVKDCSTGIAVISVNDKGQNNIVVVGGANSFVDEKYIDDNLEAISKSEVVLCQMEIPIPTVEYAFLKAKELGKTTILNPAPAAVISDRLIGLTDILVPNEHELQRLTDVSTDSTKGISDAAKIMLDKGVKILIVTLGKRGCAAFTREESSWYPAYEVKAVDTTAAGDSFIGGFLWSYMKDRNLSEAIKAGQMIASMAVQKKGAQSSLPTLKEVMEYYESLKG